ncbi:transcription factor BHLH133-like [Phragmites australis]|uniref:transcription factor BHLH133-like n=1 Tax=Phragmites australis TaxID=29695 RepID=UPI002D794F33|nr:transcription factor BHLH133-like [Phragmites australis]
MVAGRASYWSCVDGESEMIAHLQSVFLTSGDLDVDPNLCYSNGCFSLSSYSPLSLVDDESCGAGASVDVALSVALDHQFDTLASANGVKLGNKRKVQTCEQMNHGEEAHAVPSATRPRKKSGKDSQCCYAKKRRQRINERLRLLQEIIPNGTKVDISTVLEEAVEYVKFLHLQIKLLRSDEMWMHAPLAYHDINIGVHLSP